MFASVVTRKQVSADEQIALMPFKITDLADFKDIRTLAPGSSIILADGDESSGYESKPFMILGVIGATPQQADDRARFAQEARAPDPRRARIPRHHVGADPHQRPAGFRDPDRRRQRQGQDAGDRGAVDPLQSGGASLRIIASAPRDQWSAAFTRFRAVRDGIQPKG